ncbi:helix-turn-helix transcriptional regulator [Nocardioides acrostichi]|uniref:WYL domain-containing protein n=1 Tax=Nocardioides acrostichi TaxID=2784339 RepID=A0A930Y8H5_9ACTN|nr:WYL domain-containing protein [Nocardioides acrostichi]MBF4163071.1 WYL domain-containing protein [Nocardioides acrostichi]
MALPKSERLMNLLIMLLVQRHYAPKHRIREVLYPETSDEAFERMFDRDKEELRSLGVPIEVGQMDAYFDDEPGYRISAEQLQLPEIELTADEAAVIGLATRVWQHQALAEATSGAVRKLGALGVDVDTSALDTVVQPRLSADEPAFGVIWEAITQRRAVVFDYRRSGSAEVTTRHLQPWGVGRYAGRWYVTGLDTDRGEERVFRLSRIQGEARAVGRPGVYTVPPDTDVSALVRRLAPEPVREEAVLLVRRGAGHSLRRSADRTEKGVAGPDGTATWDRVHLTRTSQGLDDEVLAHGVDVVVEAPADLRARVVRRLEAYVGESG